MLFASDFSFKHSLFASSITALAEPQKYRSVEQLLKRMEELYSGDEPASNQVKLEELPLFEFQVLATAIDDFSLRSKLGQGGFGPVSKDPLNFLHLYVVLDESVTPSEVLLCDERSAGLDSTASTVVEDFTRPVCLTGKEDALGKLGRLPLIWLLTIYAPG